MAGIGAETLAGNGGMVQPPARIRGPASLLRCGASLLRRTWS
jgi:hypothetical protein